MVKLWIFPKRYPAVQDPFVRAHIAAGRVSIVFPAHVTGLAPRIFVESTIPEL